MRTRSIVAVSTTVALLGAGSAVGAVGDPADGSATGSAASTLTLLDVGLGGRSISVLELALRSERAGAAPSTSAVITPLITDGKAYGRQSVSGRSVLLPSVDTASLAPAALNALASVRSPLVDITSDGGASRAGAASLGTVSVLGIPLSLEGAASLGSSVDDAGSTGAKTLKVSRLALPSVADLLAALGLNLRALPSGLLTDLVDRLDLTSTSIVAAQAALDAALAPVREQVAAADGAVVAQDDAVEAATAQLAAAQASLAPASRTLNDAARALTGSTGALRTSRLALPSIGGTVGGTVGSTVGGVVDSTVGAPTGTVGGVVDSTTGDVTGALPSTGPTLPLIDEVQPVVDAVVPVVDGALEPVLGPVQPVVEVVAPVVEQLVALPTLPDVLPVELQPLVSTYETAKQAYDQALAAVTSAQLSLATVTALLEQAQAALDALLAPYQRQVDALVQAVVGVLDATPLLSLDRLEVSTRSVVTSAAAGGQTAEVVGGQVEGLRVLGTDVLQVVLGSSQLDVLDLAGPAKAKVDGAIAGLTGTLSSVLSQVPGLPALQVPAPQVGLLTRATVADVVDGYGVAGSALRGLTVTWPGITLPTAAALPGAASLPAIAGLPTLPSLRRGSLVNAAGDLLSQPLTLSLATLEDTARFRPARQSVPGTGTPGTGGGAPTTGAPVSGSPTTGAPTAGTPTTGTPTTGTPTTGRPTTGAPTTGAPRTGTPTTGTPTTGTPTTAAPPTGLTQLPRTGFDSAPSLLALLLLAAGLCLRRRYGTP